MRQNLFCLVGGQVEAQAKVNGIWRRLWQDDGGALLATEWVIVATILVIGIIPGLIAVRQGAVTELVEYANALLGLDQSYGFTGVAVGCGAGDDTFGRDSVRGGRAHGVSAVAEKAVRVGALNAGDVRATTREGREVLERAAHRGGVQAFTAGSGFVEQRHLNGNAKRINKGSVPATPNAGDAEPCNQK